MCGFPFGVLASLVGLAVLLGNAPAHGRLFTTPEKTTMLGLHNSLSRGNVNPKPCEPLRPLQWDDTLARVANQYASKCVFRHNPSRTTEYNRLSGRNYRGVGENFYVDSTLDDAKVVIRSYKSWSDEKSKYDYARNQCTPQRSCLHYTQLVWNATTSVGCATNVCSKQSSTNWPYPSRHRLRMTFCNYGPAGNYIGQRPYLCSRPAAPTPPPPPPRPATAARPSRPAQPARPSSSGISESERSAIVFYHNYVRKHASPQACTPLANVTWDDDLAKVSQRFANLCKFKSNRNRQTLVNGQRKKRAQPPFGYVGENLHFSANTALAAIQLASLWAEEARSYKFGKNRCVRGETCRNYTNMVQAAVTSVGCGVAVCSHQSSKKFPFSAAQHPQATLLICYYGSKDATVNNTAQPYQKCAPSPRAPS
eukprot:scpid65928/ scgid13983/ Peptidase inhibitor 16; Cysteine-rich protease inhibitor